MKIGNYIFEQTCAICPEQYNVYNMKAEQVAYVRARYGMVYAKCPDVGGDTIYSTDIDGYTCFESDEECCYHLGEIAKKLDEYLNWKNDKPVMTPEQFRDCMAEIRHERYEIDQDEEAVHAEMDDLICDLLRSLGYGDGIDIFENTPKWYS